MSEVNEQSASTSIRFQLFMMAITFGTLVLFFYQNQRTFYVAEKMPGLQRIYPAVLVELGGTPGIVRVGLSIQDFPEFDFIKNEFVLSGIIWFIFDPSLVSLDTLGKFTFEKGEIAKLSQPITKLVDGKLFARYDLRVKFKSNLDFKDFPLDNHRIYIVLDNHAVSPGEVMFETSISDFVLSDRLFVPGWKLFGKNIYSGFAVSKLEEANPDRNVYLPRIVFVLDYVRDGIRQVVTILLPLILLFFITIFTFSIDPQKYYGSIVSICSAAVTALISYRFVIENMSPKVGYFMLSDILFFLFFGLVCLIFFLNTHTVGLQKTSKKILTITLHLVIITVSFLLFNFWL